MNCISEQYYKHGMHKENVDLDAQPLMSTEDIGNVFYYQLI